MLRFKSNPLHRNIFCKSYNDHVDYFTCNRIFFIYDIGKFFNTRLYHYGISVDIDLVEYKLQKSLPYYKKLLDIPIDNCIYGVDNFDSFIKENNMMIKMPIVGLEDFDVFKLSDDKPINEVLEYTNGFFKQDIESIS